MKILHVISSLNPAGGGPAETLRQFVPELTKLGHQLITVCLDAPDDDWVTAFPGHVVTLGPTKSSYLLSPRLIPWLRENSNNFDVVIVRGIWQFQSFAVWKVFKKSKTPYLVFTHGMLDPWFKKQYPLKHLKKWLYWPWAEYRVLRDASAVLFTCEEERRLARQSFWLYQCNERVVNYGTSAPPENTEVQKNAFLSKFPETTGKRLILYLSRIHPKKGCDFLIDAFASIASQNNNLHLVMAGPDKTGWIPQLKKRAKSAGIANRITWAGMLNGDLKWGAFRNAEAFILPSHQENFGIVVAEALACGTPVLISNKVNIWREVINQHCGIVAEDTLDGTKMLLENWLKLDSVEIKKYSANSIATFQAKFEITRAALCLTEVLEEVTAN